jgi:hypothetical protein
MVKIPTRRYVVRYQKEFELITKIFVSQDQARHHVKEALEQGILLDGIEVIEGVAIKVTADISIRADAIKFG